MSRSRDSLVAKHCHPQSPSPVPKVERDFESQRPDLPLGPAFVLVTLQCFKSGYFTLVMSQETALTHGVLLDNVHLAYAPNGCPPTQKTSAFVVFHVPLTLCGTAIQVGVELRLTVSPTS